MSDTEAVDVLINLVLDESGSMTPLRGTTIEGINKILSEQREQEGNAYLSLTSFNTTFDVRYVGLNVKEVPDLELVGENAYHPNGGTKLYDAVGITVKGAEKWIENNPWFKGKVLTMIWTDGQENCSTEWHIYGNPDPEDDRDLNNLISYKQGEGWDFIFLGAGGSAWLEAQNFTSIPQANSYVYKNDVGTSNAVYAGVASATTNYRSSALSSFNIVDPAARNLEVPTGGSKGKK